MFPVAEKNSCAARLSREFSVKKMHILYRKNTRKNRKHEKIDARKRQIDPRKRQIDTDHY